MNYKIGDIVVRKVNKHDKYIFLGTTQDTGIHIVKVVKEVMGKDVEIGMFVTKPVYIKPSEDGRYVTEIMFAYTELFEEEKEIL